MTAPGDTNHGVTPELKKKMWLNLERTVNKRGRTSKKVITLQTVMTKKKVVSFFQKKIGVTPPVAAPGDTNPSGATAQVWYTIQHKSVLITFTLVMQRIMTARMSYTGSKTAEFIQRFIYKLSISKALRYGPCVTKGSHSFTCHPHMNHTGLWSQAARCHRPLASTHCAYP